MPDGGTITVAAREEVVGSNSPHGLRPGNYVSLSVTDTGIGMDEATLKRVIEPFFTTKGIGKGTGLGLSMVHGLAEQSGGRLVLRSRKGQGTTAEIWLPVAEVERETAPVQEPRIEETPATRNGHGITILVVDDDTLVLMNTAAMLEDLGHEVIEASSGEQALRVLRRGRKVDLVVTDQLMPGMTGTQLIAAIRAEWPDVPVVLATGYAELPADTDPDLLRLSKPFRQNDLARALAASIKRPEGEGQVVPFRPR
jgi:CheY-like chemotaxis protein